MIDLNYNRRYKEVSTISDTDYEETEYFLEDSEFSSSELSS